MTRTAACACGQLSAACEGEPARISVCHCLECQRRSGSAFSAQSTWPAEQVTISGRSVAWERTSEDGRWARNHFCPTCGVTVHYEIGARPGMVSVPLGGFADPSFPEPGFSVYESRRHPWVRIEPDGPIVRY
jgi:hypothetical protein